MNLQLFKFLILLTLTSCFSDFDDEWKREPYESVHFEKLVVVGLSHELQNRIFYEQEAVTELSKSGFNAIEGIEIFPQEVTRLANNQDTISSLIVANNIDAILTIKILHENDHSYMMPTDHRRFKMYYGRWGRNKDLHVSYYKKPEKYFMVGTLYNLKESHEENEETVIWRASNIIYSPEKNQEKKKEFIVNTIKHITNQHLIK